MWWIDYCGSCLNCIASLETKASLFGATGLNTVLGRHPVSCALLTALSLGTVGPEADRTGCRWISTKSTPWLEKQSTGCAQGGWKASLNFKYSTRHSHKVLLYCSQITSDAFDSHSSCPKSQWWESLAISLGTANARKSQEVHRSSTYWMFYARRTWASISISIQTN